MKTKLLFALLLSIPVFLIAQTKPEIVYSSYVGGLGDDFAGYIQLSPTDDIYMSASATGGAETTVGVHQTEHGGGEYDGLVQKRDKNGKLIWSTYYGGPGYEYINAIKVLKSGKIAIVGETKSFVKISKNGYKSTYGGGIADGFLAVFNDDGTLNWATYFGGSKEDFVVGCGEDDAGNIYINGYTKSTSGIATTGAEQTVNKGKYDSFIAKFSSDGQLLVSTYVGSTEDDLLFGLNVVNNQIWVYGESNSLTGITTNNAYQQNLAGGADALLMVYELDLTKSYATYYGGTENEQIVGLEIDKSGNVYFNGYTDSNNGIATAGSLQPNYKANGDGFLAKFNSGLQREWATYLGGSDFETLFCTTLTKDDDIILGVMTESNNYAQINHAFQPLYGGGPFDAVISKVNSQGNLIWSTFFGGTGNDRVYNIKVNSEEKLICNVEVGSNNLSTSDAEKTSLQGNFDALLLILKETEITSVHQASLNPDNIAIYPNPVNDILTLKLESLGKYGFEVSDLSGSVLDKGILKSNTIDVHHLTAGMYFLHLYDEEANRNLRIPFVKK